MFVLLCKRIRHWERQLRIKNDCHPETGNIRLAYEGSRIKNQLCN